MMTEDFILSLSKDDCQFILNAIQDLKKKKRELVDEYYSGTTINTYWDEWAKVTNLYQYLQYKFDE
jgi:hypothetical protein